MFFFLFFSAGGTFKYIYIYVVVYGGSSLLPGGGDRGDVRVHRVPDDGDRRDRGAPHL